VAGTALQFNGSSQYAFRPSLAQEANLGARVGWCVDGAA
jgi:hypothetical protein